MDRVKEVSDSVMISNLICMAEGAACGSDRDMYLNYAVNLMRKKREGRQAMTYTHLIFDLDGTLIDTEQPILKTWQAALKEYHYYYSLDELKAVLGITTQRALQKLGVAVDNDFEARWVDLYQNFAREAVFFPGTEEMLRTLKAQGRTLGIVTSRSREEYDRYFSAFHLETLFDWIVCADDTARHKPDPDPLYKYASLARADFLSCIYIGDMPTDIACAGRAGVASGLAAWNDSGVLCRDADFIFRSPEELLELLL